MGSDHNQLAYFSDLPYFYPRSPRGERPLPRSDRHEGSCISIHAPRVGSDDKPDGKHAYNPAFLSTLPAWGATLTSFWETTQMRISIHAPRVGSDCDLCPLMETYARFLSTLPAWGATGTNVSAVGQGIAFLSTLPAWGATSVLGVPSIDGRFLSTLPAWGATFRQGSAYDIRTKISIHAPRVGSDLGIIRNRPTAQGFLSTLPAWGATYLHCIRFIQWRFLSTLPAWGATTPGCTRLSMWGISIHAPRVGSDRIQDAMTGPVADISIHAPRVGSD